jgi:hypothetical protein
MAIKKTTTKKAPAKKSSSLGISISGPAKAEMRKWEIESDLNALKRAEEIRKDAKRMRDVQNLAKEQMNVLKNFSK